MWKYHCRPTVGWPTSGRWNLLPPPQPKDTVPPELLNTGWSCTSGGRKQEDSQVTGEKLRLRLRNPRF